MSDYVPPLEIANSHQSDVSEEEADEPQVQHDARELEEPQQLRRVESEPALSSYVEERVQLSRVPATISHIYRKNGQLYAFQGLGRQMDGVGSYVKHLRSHVLRENQEGMKKFDIGSSTASSTMSGDWSTTACRCTDSTETLISRQYGEIGECSETVEHGSTPSLEEDYFVTDIDQPSTSAGTGSDIIRRKRRKMVKHTTVKITGNPTTSRIDVSPGSGAETPPYQFGVYLQSVLEDFFKRTQETSKEDST